MLMDSPSVIKVHPAIDEKVIPHQHVEQHSGLGDSSLENAESFAIKKNIEKRLVWKQDLTMLPLLGLCFFFSYVDRGQIGNARIMGLQNDLSITNAQYYNSLLVFFIGYAFIELFCCLGLMYFKPGHQFGLATISFGVLATSIAAVKSYGSLITVRLLLGLTEAFVQVGFVYLSLWYTRNEIALRCALFYVSGPLAGAVSGLIAYGVAKDLNGVQGIRSWKWLFIVEGVPTIAWGILAFFALPGRPKTVADKGTWLFRGKLERELILERTLAANNEINAKFQPCQVASAFRDVKVYLDALIVAAFGLGVTAFGLFLPTFIKEFGFSPLTTQLFTIIPYATAALALPIISWIADHFIMRAIPILLCYGLCAVGLVLLLVTTNKSSRIIGTSLVSAGSYAGVILAATWVLSTYGGYTKRSTAWAFCHLCLQAYSILGTKIYDEPPRFLKGHGVVLGLQTLAAVCLLGKWWIMSSANRKKEALKLEYETRGESLPGSEMSLEELNDDHPAFRYIL